MDSISAYQKSGSRQRSASVQATFPNAPGGYTAPHPNTLQEPLPSLHPTGGQRSYNLHNPYELPTYLSVPQVINPQTLKMAVDYDATHTFKALHLLVRERNELRVKNQKLEDALNREYDAHQSDVNKLQDAYKGVVENFDTLRNEYRIVRSMGEDLERSVHIWKTQLVLYMRMVYRLRNNSEVALPDEEQKYPLPKQEPSIIPREIYRRGLNLFQMDSLSETSERLSERGSESFTESSGSIAACDESDSTRLDPNAQPFTPQLGFNPTASNTEDRAISTTPRAGSVNSNKSNKSNKSKKGKYKKPSKSIKSDKSSHTTTPTMGSPVVAAEPNTFTEPVSETVAPSDAEIEATLEAIKQAAVYDPIKRTPERLLVNHVPIEYLNVCPHSLSQETPCPALNCTLDKLCKVFNDVTGTMGLCNSHNCAYGDVHVHRSCPEYISTGKCSIIDGKLGIERDNHIRYRVHPVGKNRIAMLLWIKRVDIARLQNVHYKGEY